MRKLAHAHHTNKIFKKIEGLQLCKVKKDMQLPLLMICNPIINKT